jgi:excisionase family DNA binding protein
MTAREPLPELMTPGEVAAVLRVDDTTVVRWARNGRIRSIKTPGGHHRYYAEDVEKLVRGGQR